MLVIQNLEAVAFPGQVLGPQKIQQSCKVESFRRIITAPKRAFAIANPFSWYPAARFSDQISQL